MNNRNKYIALITEVQKHTLWEKKQLLKLMNVVWYEHISTQYEVLKDLIKANIIRQESKNIYYVIKNT